MIVRKMTILEAENLLPRARKVAARLNIPYSNAPLALGHIQLDNVSQDAIRFGMRVAQYITEESDIEK